MMGVLPVERRKDVKDTLVRLAREFGDLAAANVLRDTMGIDRGVLCQTPMTCESLFASFEVEQEKSRTNDVEEGRHNKKPRFM